MLAGKCAPDTDSSGDDCAVFVTSAPLLDLATSLARPAGCVASTGVDGCDANRGNALASNSEPPSVEAAAAAVTVDPLAPACKPLPPLFVPPPPPPPPTLLSAPCWCWWWCDELVAVGVPECA